MKPFSLMLASAVLVFGAAAANAATVTFSFSTPLQPAEIAQTGFLGRFDSSLGTLTAVSLRLEGQILTTLGLTNTSDVERAVRATSFVDLVFNSTFGPLDAILDAPPTSEVQVSATTGDQSIGPLANASFGPLAASASTTWTSGAELAGILDSFAVAGGGAFAVSCVSFSGLLLQGGGGFFSSTQSLDAACGASIEYTYTLRGETPVPTPASLGLIGAALTFLSVMRRPASRG